MVKTNKNDKNPLYEQKDTDATWLKVKCPECGHIFYKRKSSARGNKSGKYFCSSRCAGIYFDRGVSKDDTNVICEFHASTKAMEEVIRNPRLEVDDNGIIGYRSYF